MKILMLEVCRSNFLNPRHIQVLCWSISSEVSHQ